MISSVSSKTPSASDAALKLRVYGRRKGKPLKPARQAVFERLAPTLRIAVPASGALDPSTLFADRCRAVWLEIGFGAGEHLAANAAAHRDVGIIGCEVFINGVASLARHVEAASLTNVRVFDDDARILLAALPAASLARVFLLFPDPWPKARHAKRRFVSPETLDQLARTLAPGAELRIASDDPGYVRWTLTHVTRHPGFQWLATGPDDWRTQPPDSVTTRYQSKALAAGRTPVFLRFRRVGQSPRA